MSHEIALDAVTGKHMCFTAGPLPWHKLGENVQRAQDWLSAKKLAHLDWDVIKDQLFSRDGHEVPAYGIFRRDTMQCLGVVGDRYEPLQNQYAFDFVDTIIGANGGTHYESAGGLYNGQVIWCLARLPKGDGEVVPGDAHQTYLLFTSSHDGSKATTAKIVTVRVVCNNTLAMALKGQDVAIRIKHTAQAERKLEYAKRFLSDSVSQVEDIRAKLRTLASREMTKESFQTALDRMFPTKPGEDISTRRKNVLGEIIECYERNDGKNAIQCIKGTAYNLLNAVTEWTDHLRSVRMTDKREGMNESLARADNALFGTGSTLKNQALDIIMEATEGNPIRSIATTYYPTIQAPISNGGLLDSICDVTRY